MGNYYKLKDKASMVVRPVLPRDFFLIDDMLRWDDLNAVYDFGVIEHSKDKETWEALSTFLPNVQSAEAGTHHNRMRVWYNSHWSEYLQAEKLHEEPEVKVVKKKKKK